MSDCDYGNPDWPGVPAQPSSAATAQPMSADEFLTQRMGATPLCEPLPINRLGLGNIMEQFAAHREAPLLQKERMAVAAVATATKTIHELEQEIEQLRQQLATRTLERDAAMEGSRRRQQQFNEMGDLCDQAIALKEAAIKLETRTAPRELHECQKTLQ